MGFPKKLECSHTFDLSSNWNSKLLNVAVLSVLLCLQLAVSINPHSGQSQPPMYGDYEAQRHWMEVTYNLPVSQWYVNGTDNDLMYWGLDYPPLTAYHHHLLGIIAGTFNNTWVALKTSRGVETVAHKMFMRLSAVLPFYIVYVPPLIFSIGQPKSSVASVLSLLYPALVVIDNGHFQYNSISLGLFLLTIMFLVRKYTLIGSVCFVAALNYKQMELYHALPVFVYILSNSIDMKQPLQSILKIAKVGTVVIISFLLFWMPFLITKSAKDVLLRVFPFNRGVYEDKVASFWCAFSFILKRLPLSNFQIHLSAISVLLFAAPSLIQLYRRPSEHNFKLSLLVCSLSFFLFSFHVHEKTILLAAVPAILLLPKYPREVTWLLHISNISIFSLCVKDNFVTSVFLFFLYFIVSQLNTKGKISIGIDTFSVLGGILICSLELYGPTPERFPHIYQLFNAFYCCLHFIYFLFFFTCKSLEAPSGK